MMDYLVDLRSWEVPMICCIMRKTHERASENIVALSTTQGN
jgi:hypothetical protein